MKVSSKRGFSAGLLAVLVTMSLMLAACGDATSSAPMTLTNGATPPVVTAAPTKLADGLQYIDLTVGTGAVAAAGKTVTVNYTGWIAPSGPKFDSSLDHGSTFDFPLGGGRVIPGWDEGVAGMKIGGLRRLIIPSALGYGPQGDPPTIPGGATLIFDVQLVGVQ